MTTSSGPVEPRPLGRHEHRGRPNSRITTAAARPPSQNTSSRQTSLNVRVDSTAGSVPRLSSRRPLHPPGPPQPTGIPADRKQQPATVAGRRSIVEKTGITRLCPRSRLYRDGGIHGSIGGVERAGGQDQTDRPRATARCSPGSSRAVGLRLVACTPAARPAELPGFIAETAGGSSACSPTRCSGTSRIARSTPIERGWHRDHAHSEAPGQERRRRGNRGAEGGLN